MLKKLSPSAATHVASLIVACAGFLVLLAAGVPELQPFPPGVPVLLTAAAAVLAMPGRRWVPLIGVGLCMVIAFGAFVIYEGTLIRLVNPAETVRWAGTILQMGGVIAAIVARSIAAPAAHRARATAHVPVIGLIGRGPRRFVIATTPDSPGRTAPLTAGGHIPVKTQVGSGVVEPIVDPQCPTRSIRRHLLHVRGVQPRQRLTSYDADCDRPSRNDLQEVPRDMSNGVEPVRSQGERPAPGRSVIYRRSP